MNNACQNDKGLWKSGLFSNKCDNIERYFYNGKSSYYNFIS